jgi:hypothetical protein
MIFWKAVVWYCYFFMELCLHFAGFLVCFAIIFIAIAIFAFFATLDEQ